MRASIGPRRCAPATSVFGRKLVDKYFPNLSPSANLSRAWIAWRKVDRGGWVREGSSSGEPSGYVVRPGLIDVILERKRATLYVSTIAQRTQKAPVGYDFPVIP